MTVAPVYVLDANVFIKSKREHYAPDFCPGFWDAIRVGYLHGTLISIQPVREELMKGKDFLSKWVQEQVPERFFAAVDAEPVLEAYRNILQWVEANDADTRAAKSSFANAADPMLVAYATANGCELVTYEVSSPESRSAIKLPDVAKQFNVSCLRPYSMLRQIRARLILDRAASDEM